MTESKPKITWHDDLFTQYLPELETAVEESAKWWKDLILRETGRWGEATTARRKLRQRWPCGPASHPRVLGVLIRYHAACDALNEQATAMLKPSVVDDEGPVTWGEASVQEPEVPVEWSFEEPIVFLVERLGDDHEDLADFLDALTFLPVP